jgi:hypothetical protein
MNARPEVILFAGPTKWVDRDPIRRDLEGLHQDSLVIVQKMPGVARIAGQEARRLGIHVAEVAALWDFHDRSAGYRCNEAIARLQPEFLYAYGESAGTRHMISTAEAECIQVRER